MSATHQKAPTAPGKSPARNDPCPCGSGLKYKQCCAIRPRVAKPPAPARKALGPLTAFGRQLAVQVGLDREAAGPNDAKDEPDAPAAAAGGRSPELAAAIREAGRLLEAGSFEAAIPALQQAARLDPKNQRVRFDLGRVLIKCGRPAEAADSLSFAVRLDPKSARAHLFLGQALAQIGKVTPAIAAYREAVALAPKLADAHLELAQLLLSRVHNEAAAVAYEKAAAALAGTTRGRLAAAWALIARRRPDEALTLFERAVSLDPKSTDARRQMANALMDEGRFDEAEQQLTAALALDPAGAADYYGLVNLRRLTHADRPLLQRMAALLADGSLSRRERMLLQFGLGKAHNDLKEFEAAIGHYDAANRIRCANSPLDRGGLVEFVDRQLRRFPAGSVGVERAAAADDELPVLILGLPRSGTTLVEQVLSAHPAVAAGGELGFWAEHGPSAVAPAAGPLTPDALDKLAAGYKGMLRGISADARRVTDKNPFNFFYTGLIRAVMPRAFIIHCRRHPVDNCLSMYTTYLGARENNFMGNREDLVFYYGQYARVMRHWREVLPPARFMEIEYESLVADPETEARRLVSFCGLEWDDACLRPERNQRNVATASRWQARQPVYRTSLERWRNYEPWLGPFARLLPEAPG